jgi:crotonobetainyl-CoA:carnitine CoA-transferase CaiB-like acyl-CoA transferase
MAMAEGILDGLSVVELSDTPTSAQVGQLLADFGADVVHVEPPGGSRLRALPAFPLWARGKRSIELDLRAVADREVVVGLARGADVVVESFRAGAAERLGIGYDVLGAANPRLVYASIKGFPTASPLGRIPGYEALVLAKAGGFHAFAPSVKRPGPAFASVPYSSFSAVQTALHGILAALHEREQSGAGQRFETTLLQAVASLDPFNWMNHVVIERYSEAFTSAPVFSERGTPNSPFVYMLMVALTKDGRWLQFSQVQPHLYRAFMNKLDLEWMFDDPKWAGIPVLESEELRVELWETMLERVQSFTLAEWQEMFEADHNVWAELFRHGTELLDHPQMVHDRRVVVIEDAERGPVRQPGPMVMLSGTPGRAETSAPRRDEHHAELRARATDPPAAPAAPATEPRSLPLAGVTVLELGTFYAGPFGATVLTDLGARVVKAEPLDGDPLRFLIPFPEAGAARVLQGKESVAVDIATEEGREIVYELARRSDLVLQTFRAGVAARLGLDADSLRAVNPDLVYVNAPGYGIDGPCGDRPAYAPTIGAGAGVARRNAGDTIEERPGMTIPEIRDNSWRLIGTNNVAFAQTDGLSALGVATASLLCLLGRDRGTGGQTALTTMLSTVAHALSDDMVEYAGKPELVRADDEMYGFGPLYRLYPADGGWIFLAAPHDHEWARLVAALAPHVDVAVDERFATSGGRAEHADALAEVLAAAFATRAPAAWEADLLDAGVGCVEVTERLPEDAFLSGLGEEAGILAEVTSPIFDEYQRLAPMVRFSRSETVALPGCTIGQHTTKVLRELGYADEHIADLRERGVIRG